MSYTSGYVRSGRENNNKEYCSCHYTLTYGTHHRLGFWLLEEQWSLSSTRTTASLLPTCEEFPSKALRRGLLSVLSRAMTIAKYYLARGWRKMHSKLSRWRGRGSFRRGVAGAGSRWKMAWETLFGGPYARRGRSLCLSKGKGCICLPWQNIIVSGEE